MESNGRTQSFSIQKFTFFFFNWRVIVVLPSAIHQHESAFSSVQFSHSVKSDSLQLHELQHARPPCRSPTPRVHSNSMLLLLLSRFSRVRLLATPWTAAHQAPPSVGSSRQECWSGVPLPSPSGAERDNASNLSFLNSGDSFFIQKSTNTC